MSKSQSRRIILQEQENELPTGDRLLFFDNDTVLELKNGDRLFICNGSSLLDSELSFDFEICDGQATYSFENGDGIVVRNGKLLFLRRGDARFIADPETPRCFWICNSDKSEVKL